MKTAEIHNRRIAAKPGFTLIELLLVISILAITAGVTGDIMLSLVRGYSKTRINNEIELNANFVTLKFGKELRKSIGIPTYSASNTRIDFADNSAKYCYYVNGGIVYRGVATLSGACNPTTMLTNNNATNGVAVTCGTGGCFQDVSDGVVKIHMIFDQQGGASVAKAFVSSLEIEDTIVVRGNY